jgi:YqaJ-like viral recombinase domain
MNDFKVIEGTAELVGTYVQDSPEWHAFRASVVGSSDVASILGVGFKSAYTLWHEKRGLIEPLPPSEKMRRKFAYGHHMEPFIAGLFVEGHPGWHVETGVGSWRHIERTWQGCNPDALVAESKDEPLVPLEMKTFPSLADWQEGPPPGYVAQLLWQADTFGAPGGWLAGYANMSGDYVEHWFDADAFAAAAVRSKVREFLDGDEPPEIDGSEDTYLTLRRLNPSIPDPKAEVDIPQDVAEQYLEAAAQYKFADSELLRWKGHLLAHMGTAKFAVYDGRKIASRVASKPGAVPYLKEA